MICLFEILEKKLFFSRLKSTELTGQDNISFKQKQYFSLFFFFFFLFKQLGWAAVIVSGKIFETEKHKLKLFCGVFFGGGAVLGIEPRALSLPGKCCIT
jgi:hypothetical protein